MPHQFLRQALRNSFLRKTRGKRVAERMKIQLSPQSVERFNFRFGKVVLEIPLRVLFDGKDCPGIIALVTGQARELRG